MPNLEDAIFNLRFTIKQLDKLSKKAEKASSDERIKVKKALEKGDKGSAQIYAENAIRKRNESLNFLRLSARVDAVSSRVQTALTMKSVVRGIDQVTKDLERAMSSFELEKVSQIMSKFEKQFEDLDVKSSTVENAMGSAVTTMTPEADVMSLIKQVADENGLSVAEQLGALPVADGTVGVGSQAEASNSKQQDELTRRLAQLRN